MSASSNQTFPGISLPAEVYFMAVNSGDLATAVGAFDPAAEIIDVTRHIRGHQAIEAWARNEVLGGTYAVLGAKPYEGGEDILVEFTPPGSHHGFRASYRFDINGDKIQRANLQYAD